MDTLKATPLARARATFHDSVRDTFPSSLDDDALALGRHLQQCERSRKRWYPAAVWMELAHHLVAPRFVTTVVGATLMLTALTLWG
ncbi:MAG: hypothetical protein ABI574_07180 [Burkholderiales bacterium]